MEAQSQLQGCDSRSLPDWLLEATPGHLPLGTGPVSAAGQIRLGKHQGGPAAQGCSQEHPAPTCSASFHTQPPLLPPAPCPPASGLGDCIPVSRVSLLRPLPLSVQFRGHREGLGPGSGGLSFPAGQASASPSQRVVPWSAQRRVTSLKLSRTLDSLPALCRRSLSGAALQRAGKGGAVLHTHQEAVVPGVLRLNGGAQDCWAQASLCRGVCPAPGPARQLSPELQGPAQRLPLSASGIARPLPWLRRNHPQCWGLPVGGTALYASLPLLPCPCLCPAVLGLRVPLPGLPFPMLVTLGSLWPPTEGQPALGHQSRLHGKCVRREDLLEHVSPYSPVGKYKEGVTVCSRPHRPETGWVKRGGTESRIMWYLYAAAGDYA